MKTMRVPEIPFPLIKWNGELLLKNLVYVFIKRGAVVYIGSTGDIRQREGDGRRSGYSRDSIWYFETGTRGEAYDCEFWLIQNLKPKHNSLRMRALVPYPPFFTYGSHLTFAARKEAE